MPVEGTNTFFVVVDSERSSDPICKPVSCPCDPVSQEAVSPSFSAQHFPPSSFLFFTTFYVLSLYAACSFSAQLFLLFHISFHFHFPYSIQEQPCSSLPGFCMCPCVEEIPPENYKSCLESFTGLWLVVGTMRER